MGTNKTWLLSFTAVVWFTSVSSQNSKLCDLLVKAAQQEIFQKQFFGRDESQDIILLDTSKYLGSCSPVLLSGKRRLSVRQASGLKASASQLLFINTTLRVKPIRFGFNDRIQVRPWNWDSGINLESGIDPVRKRCILVNDFIYPPPTSKQIWRNELVKKGGDILW